MKRKLAFYKTLMEVRVFCAIQNRLWLCTDSKYKKFGEFIVGKNNCDEDYDSLLKAEVLKYIQSLKKYLTVIVNSRDSALVKEYHYSGEHKGKPVYK